MSIQNMPEYTPIFNDLGRIGVPPERNKALDASQTREELIELLKQWGVPQIKNRYGSTGYPLRVTRVGAGMYGPTKRWRLYFGTTDRHTNQTFMQSDDDGRMETQRIVNRLTERFAEDQVREDSHRKDLTEDDDNDALASEYSNELRDTGFRVIATSSGFVIEKPIHSKQDLEALVLQIKDIRV